MCFVVTCWERADLLALVCGVYCEFVTFPLVSWVRCGTWLYRFLIVAPLLTLIDFKLSDVVLIMLMNVKYQQIVFIILINIKMSTIVGILTFMTYLLT